MPASYRISNNSSSTISMPLMTPDQLRDCVKEHDEVKANPKPQKGGLKLTIPQNRMLRIGVHLSVVVTNDQFHKILKKNPLFLKFVENKILIVTKVKDPVMLSQEAENTCGFKDVEEASKAFPMLANIDDAEAYSNPAAYMAKVKAGNSSYDQFMGSFSSAIKNEAIPEYKPELHLEEIIESKTKPKKRATKVLEPVEVDETQGSGELSTTSL